MPHTATETHTREELSDLLLATSAGDRAAFRRLYDATCQRLFGMAMLLLRRRDVAEDVLQDGYLRVWSSARSFDPARGAALPWMARIVRNVAIDRLRQENRVFDELGEHADTLAAITVPLDGDLDLARALDSLSKDQRAAVTLMYVYGFTSQEIADRMKAPVGTVKSWIRRGAGRLHRQFHGDTVSLQTHRAEAVDGPG